MEPPMNVQINASPCWANKSKKLHSNRSEYRFAQTGFWQLLQDSTVL